MLKTNLRAFTCGVIASFAMTFSADAHDDHSTEVDMPKLSETFGNLLGKNMKDSGFDFDIDQVIVGIRKGINNEAPALNTEQYQTMMMIVQQNAFKKLSDENLRKAETFMKENATADGVKTIESNKLQYLVLQKGTGAVVTEEDSPQINYSGKYVDGTVFSTSEETGGPITIPLKHTIPGFRKGITGMAEGEKRRLFIHPDEGYGSSAGHLPPNSLLIFDIELLAAKSNDADDADQDDDDSEDDEDDSEDEDTKE
jgi:peptidylprolyl isomerase